jgi:staphylococcal nuclease domain-containing protein 1
MSWLRGVVKEVGSGDQLTVVSSADHAVIPRDCPEVRAEKRLFLTGIRAPRMGRANASAAEAVDEACARQARQALRGRVVGKNVVFKIDSVNATSGMEFGSVFVGQENVALSQLQQGLAKVNPNGLRDLDPETERQFKQAEEGAQARGLGLWKNGNANTNTKKKTTTTTTTTKNTKKANNNNNHNNNNSSSKKNTAKEEKEHDSFFDMTEPKKKKRSGGGKKKREKEAAAQALALQKEKQQQKQQQQAQQAQQAPQYHFDESSLADFDDGTPMHTKTVQVSGQAANEVLFNKYRALGAPVKALIEHVGSGHILRASIPLLLEDNDNNSDNKVLTYETATVFLAGVGCPNVRPKPAEGQGNQSVTKAEPFAVKAKVLVENLVLNREVYLKFEALDKYGNLFVSVSRISSNNPIGMNLAETLLKEGLAKVVDWSSRMLPPMSASRLRQAEKTSKQERQGMWYNFVAAQGGEGGSSLAGTSEFKATVMEVVSGDTLVLWLPKERAEKRVQLSSIRAPRLASRRQQDNNNREGEPFAVQAKEFLRSKLIGKEVNVKMEYERKIPLGGPAAAQSAAAPAGDADGGDGASANPPAVQQTRTLGFANVTLEERTGGISKTSNVSIMLLVRGLAQTVKHRSEDDMSGVYEELVEAESKALKAKKGVHSGKRPAPPGRVNDLGNQSSQAKSKQFLPFLQRSERVHAVVDYVLSGHRFKISIPKDSLHITFALSEVRCPGRGEPFSEEALKYAKVHCMQRDVELEVHSIDKMGTFTGRLFIASAGRGVDFAQALVLSGLAKVQGYSVSAGSPLVTAMNKARDTKLNIWKDYKEPEVEEEGQASGGSGNAEAKVETMKIRAVNVVSGSVFYAQRVDDQTASLLGEISSLSLSETTTGGFQVGEVVLCKYAGDGQVYRAKVEAYDRAAKTYDVFYVDFGNRDKAPEKSISPLPSLGLKTSNPLAFACQLAFVKAPLLNKDDFGCEAAEFLQSLVGQGQVLTAQVEDRVSEVVSGKKAETITKVTLVDPATNENVAVEMVRNGLCRVERLGRFAKTKEAVKVLQEEEAVAKKDHLNMWQYGDCGSDDEDQPAAWGRR